MKKSTYLFLMVFLVALALPNLGQAQPVGDYGSTPYNGGNSYGGCATVPSPNYDADSGNYTATGTCGNGNSVYCSASNFDSPPIYKCRASGNSGEDPNLAISAQQACGCVGN